MATNLEQIFSAVGGIAIFIILIIIALLIYVAAMRAGINAVKGSNTSTSDILITAFITFFLNLVIDIIIIVLPFSIPFAWVIGLILTMLIIKSRHDTSFLGALGALIIAFIVLIILMIIVIIILGFFLPISINVIWSLISSIFGNTTP